MYPDARCLDGSKGGYYMYDAPPPAVTRVAILISHIHSYAAPDSLRSLPSRSASSRLKWRIFLEGGGWCTSNDDCLSRSKASRLLQIPFRFGSKSLFVWVPRHACTGIAGQHSRTAAHYTTPLLIRCVFVENSQQRRSSPQSLLLSAPCKKKKKKSRPHSPPRKLLYGV